MHLNTSSLFTDKEDLTRGIPGLGGGRLKGCLVSRAFRVSGLLGAILDDVKTFNAAMKCPSTTFWRHSRMFGPISSFIVEGAEGSPLIAPVIDIYHPVHST